MIPEFQPFGKIARLSREIVVTEKIDGTNAQILVTSTADLTPEEDVPPGGAVTVVDGQSYYLLAGSRSRWLAPGKNTDNHGFAGWVHDHAGELVKLGVGRHFGEWWGKGVNRGYGISEKRFSLFNVGRWHDYHWGGELSPGSLLTDGTVVAPECCHVVPVLYRGQFDAQAINEAIIGLTLNGSRAAPGFMKPEGIIVYHTAAGTYFKKTIEKDELPKGLAA